MVLGEPGDREAELVSEPCLLRDLRRDFRRRLFGFARPHQIEVLGWLFVGWLFRPWLPAGQIDSYIAGLILLAAAPCTAMVFVWSNLTDGEPNFTLTQVALNDTIMVFAFAPIVGLLLGLSSITVPWTTLFLSVMLYIVVPVIAAQLWRRSLLAQGGEPALVRTLRTMQPISLIALLATLVLLFGFQGEQIVRQPLIIVLLAVPIIIQVCLNAGIAYAINRALGVPSIEDNVSGLLDELAVEQIADNLLSNAVKYGAGEPIEVSLFRNGTAARLTVRDHGIGISEEDQTRIFGPFERAVTRREHGGFGIGLWVVRQLVDAMRGEVHVASRPAQGSTFAVTLPLSLT
jgi:arsenical-resistance protein